MAATTNWVALSALSALGVGLLASSAIGVANAMPLVDSTTTAEVPPISTLPAVGTGGESGDITFPVPISSPDPAPESSPSIDQAPPPQPVAPAPAAPTGDSTASPISPASVDGDVDD